MLNRPASYLCIALTLLFSISSTLVLATESRDIQPGLANQFLTENARKSDIKTTPSGLQYKIIQEGNGIPPGPTDFVTVNYRGTLVDGTEFDSSYKHNSPTTFALNTVIPGWTEALQLMKPGAKWTIYLPPTLAYGKQGAGRLIGPDATLIFDVELIAVKPSLDNSGENQLELDDEAEYGG